MIQTVLDWVREAVGNPEFYHVFGDYSKSSWDYGLIFQYACACIILCVCVSWVFKFLIEIFK